MNMPWQQSRCWYNSLLTIEANMSFSSHKRWVMNEQALLAHRASHARSCVNHVANQLGKTRKDILLAVQRQTGIDMEQIACEADLMLAWAALEAMRL